MNETKKEDDLKI